MWRARSDFLLGDIGLTFGSDMAAPQTREGRLQCNRYSYFQKEKRTFFGSAVGDAAGASNGGRQSLGDSLGSVWRSAGGASPRLPRRPRWPAWPNEYAGAGDA